MKKTIRFERQNAVGRIVLANPPYNRLDLQFSESLRQAVHDASQSDIRVLVIQAEGPHFSFGGEVREWAGQGRQLVPYLCGGSQSVLPRDRGAEGTHHRGSPGICV